jgi:hypothetical protein
MKRMLIGLALLGLAGADPGKR